MVDPMVGCVCVGGGGLRPLLLDVWIQYGDPFEPFSGERKPHNMLAWGWLRHMIYHRSTNTLAHIIYLLYKS
jgi:hypothetical protein